MMTHHNRTNTHRGPWRGIAVGALACTLGTLGGFVAQPARAQTCSYQSCPADYPINATPIQPVSATFKFQTRVSQAKLPVGEAVFDSVFVNLVDNVNNQVVCAERLDNVQVRDSVMNLEIGRGFPCILSDEIARRDDLSFQICIKNPDNCLTPIALSTVPYAIKSNYALQSQQAEQANFANQSNYAHRISADYNLLTTPAIGDGFYDFHTPLGSQTSTLSGSPAVNGGYMKWTPVDFSNDRTLNICAGTAAGGLTDLTELNLYAANTHVRQLLEVDADAMLDSNAAVALDLDVGLSATIGVDATIGRDAHVTQDLTVGRNATIAQLTTMRDYSVSSVGTFIPGSRLEVLDGAVAHIDQVAGPRMDVGVAANNGTSVPDLEWTPGQVRFGAPVIQFTSETFNPGSRLVVPTGATADIAQVGSQAGAGSLRLGYASNNQTSTNPNVQDTADLEWSPGTITFGAAVTFLGAASFPGGATLDTNVTRHILSAGSRTPTTPYLMCMVSRQQTSTGAYVAGAGCNAQPTQGLPDNTPSLGRRTWTMSASSANCEFICY